MERTTFNYQHEKIYLVARNLSEGYLIQTHEYFGTDITLVHPYELILNKKKMGEFSTLVVSARGLAEPGTYGELLPGNQVYEVEFHSDMSYKLRPRTFVPACLGLASSIPVQVTRNGEVRTENLDMLAVEFIIRNRFKTEGYSDTYAYIEKVYDAVMADPTISIEGTRSVEEAYIERASIKETPGKLRAVA